MSSVDRIILAIRALLIPISGVNRGLDGIFSRAKLASTDLEAAARAGALCEVVSIPAEFRDKSTKALRKPKIFRLREWSSANVFY